MNKRQIRIQERSGKTVSRSRIDNVGVPPWKRYLDDPLWLRWVRYFGETLLP